MRVTEPVACTPLVGTMVVLLVTKDHLIVPGET